MSEILGWHFLRDDSTRSPYGENLALHRENLVVVWQKDQNYIRALEAEVAALRAGQDEG